MITYGLFKFGIIKLDLQGNVIAKGPDDLAMPRSIKYVAETDCVYVLDSGKQELLQFDMELRKQSREAYLQVGLLH
jgi:hypothetical protein